VDLDLSRLAARQHAFLDFLLFFARNEKLFFRRDEVHCLCQFAYTYTHITPSTIVHMIDDFGHCFGAHRVEMGRVGGDYVAKNGYWDTLKSRALWSIITCMPTRVRSNRYISSILAQILILCVRGNPRSWIEVRIRSF
jgi:hypothetical protein